jgi:hypothetical protein
MIQMNTLLCTMIIVKKDWVVPLPIMVMLFFYESQKLKLHKWNYATHDLDMIVIIHVLKMWRHYLLGRKFKLRTNPSGMMYLFEKSTLNAQKVRVLEFLSEYEFDIKHIKGKENIVDDTLNNKVQKCMHHP